MKIYAQPLSQRMKLTIRILLVGCVVLLIFWSVCWFANDIFGHEVPLYSAAQEGDWPRVQALLAKGADPNETTDLQNYRTALFWAAYQGRADIVQLLIHKGINVNIVDTHGQTALDYVGGSRRGNPSEVVLLLEQAGAKKGSDL